jgi:hypothetical protein
MNLIQPPAALVILYMKIERGRWTPEEFLTPEELSSKTKVKPK